MNKFTLEGYLEELKLLTGIDSGSGNTAGLERMAEYFEEKYAALGWIVRRHAESPLGSPCLVITNTEPECDATGKLYDILILGHMDTVFGKGEAEKRPFRVEGNKAFGPGVIDMKSGLLSLYYALSDLKNPLNKLYDSEKTYSGSFNSCSGNENMQSTVNNADQEEIVFGGDEKYRDYRDISICVLLNSDEETGSHASQQLISELAAVSRCALVMEPARENGSLVLERKGTGVYHIRFHGLSAHAGVEPGKGINAIEEMAHWIIELQKSGNQATGTTLNVCVVSGGTVSNVIPDYAELHADLRFLNGGEADRISGRLEHMRKHPLVKGIHVDFSGGVNRPPMKSCEGTKVLCGLVEDTAKTLGINIGWVVTGGGSDGNFAAAAGIPVLDGLGPVGGGSHSCDEYLSIDSVQQRIELLKGVIRNIGRNRIKF